MPLPAAVLLPIVASLVVGPLAGRALSVQHLAGGPLSARQHGMPRAPALVTMLEEDPASAAANKATLEKLYADSGLVTPVAQHALPGTLQDLPLLRVPWTVLPGVRQVLLVAGPEWVHMFETLARSTPPGRRMRYGHLTLPANSSSVALPLHAMISGSATPTVGVLMEVQDLRRLPDGRLSVVAQSICRLRVIQPTAASPYPRGDVALMPDEEELGLTGLRREGGSNSVSHLPRHTRTEAARAAAAAAALAWAEAEIDACGDDDLMGELDSTHNDAASEGESHGSSPLREDLAPLNPRLSIAACHGQARSAAAQAAEAAILAAIEDVEQHLGRPASAPSPAGHEADALQLCLEQLDLPSLDGLAGSSQIGDGGAAAEGRPANGKAAVPVVTLPSAQVAGASPFLLALEQAMWTELVLCLHLSRILTGEAAALPSELLMLLPPAPSHGWPEGMPEAPSAAEWLQRWGYPPLRRAQRLSFLLGAALPSLLAASASLPVPKLPKTLERQALLQTMSVRERLQRAVVYLCHHRQRLAALVALRTAE